MSPNVRRVAIVTARFPFGVAEPYLNTELRELIKHFERIAVVPVRLGTGAMQPLPANAEVLDWPLFSKPLLKRAVRVFRSKPRATLRAIADLLTSKDPGRMKNVAVMLKGIALADWILERGYDHVHAYWLSTPATVAFIAARISGVSWSATAHRWDIYERNAFDVKGRTAAFVRTISARGAADVWKRMPQAAARVTHLRLGAVVPEQPADVNAERAQFSIVCPAALVPVKGHADLLEAVAQLHAWRVPVRCTFAGQGPLEQTLKQQAASLGIADAVEFPGYVPQSELLDGYRNSRYHAVVLASRSDGVAEMEGVPSALIEAMAEGVPVVATDSGSIGELLDERSGWIVPSSQPAALANALRDVYLRPEAARIRARRAFEVVAQRHDVRTQMRELAGMLTGERRSQ
ncbi:MAG TPA: glycosyltransferase [Candidatus Baltobacteraceae bacterium]|nr:glycosyltransferase [Candidatus Baltobacteraceae bacterium]